MAASVCALLFVVLNLAAIVILAIIPPAPSSGGAATLQWIASNKTAMAGLGSLAWTLYLVLGASIAAIGVGWWRSSPGNGNHSELS